MVLFLKPGCKPAAPLGTVGKRRRQQLRLDALDSRVVLVGTRRLELLTSTVSICPYYVFQRLTTPRGLPKHAEVVQGSRFCGLDCGLQNSVR